ncbi:MAG: nucleotide exchange factor GrpE [Ruminococcus sp.]|nr:nucleotide exchange factor GrpE [Ruminococcus sp.]
MAKKKKDENPEEVLTEETVGETVEETEEAEAVDAEVLPEEEATDEKEEKIKSLTDEIAAQKDRFLRLMAEYDNYRKRTANEKLSLYDDATSKAVAELLPVADSVRMALENLKDADPEILKGIGLIQTQLERSFSKLKVESYGEVGDAFDPNLHNAVSMVDSEDVESNHIAAVFQTGYKIGDKIIRHAMVQVAN